MIAKDFSSKVLLHWLLFNLETCNHRFRGLFLYLYFETEIMEQYIQFQTKTGTNTFIGLIITYVMFPLQSLGFFPH